MLSQATTAIRLPQHTIEYFIQAAHLWPKQYTIQVRMALKQVSQPAFLLVRLCCSQEAAWKRGRLNNSTAAKVPENSKTRSQQGEKDEKGPRANWTPAVLRNSHRLERRASPSIWLQQQ